jgi:hypothetical protein
MNWLPIDRTPLRAAALAYAAHGWPVFPVNGKLPLTAHGFSDATVDPLRIAEWWTRWPDAGIGWAPPPDVLIVDVDPRHAGDVSLRALQEEHEPFPTTLEAETGGGGAHVVLRGPAEERPRQLTGWRPGIDTRCGGRGYVVLAPSLHASGRRYRWRTNLVPALAPTWMVEALRPPAPAPRSTYSPPISPAATTRRQRYALAVLLGEAKAVAETAEGGRNARLNKAWWRCAQFRDVLIREEVERDLTAAAAAAGLPMAEIAKVLR